MLSVFSFPVWKSALHWEKILQRQNSLLFADSFPLPQVSFLEESTEGDVISSALPSLTLEALCDVFALGGEASSVLPSSTLEAL